jgi:hypothetical protein
MRQRRLESLGERLLRAGIAPRHVRRYLAELRDHLDDAAREESARGLDDWAAERAAWARLGDDEHLAQSVLSRPELRSVGARFPGIVFGAAPVVVWIAAVALTLSALALLPEASASRTGPAPSWQLLVAYWVCFSYLRVLPVVLGAAALAASARQRLSSLWPMVGAALLALIGGTTGIDLVLVSAADDKGHLTVGSTLIPFFLPFPDSLGKADVAALAQGLARAGFMLAISLTPYLVWRRRQRPPTTA